MFLFWDHKTMRERSNQANYFQFGMDCMLVFIIVLHSNNLNKSSMYEEGGDCDIVILF
jgi:hypothetical protein